MASTANSSMEKRAPTGLMDLPVETRLQIYGHLVVFPGKQEILDNIAYMHLYSSAEAPRAVLTYPGMSTAILRTSKQIYREAVAVVWENVILLLCDSLENESLLEEEGRLRFPPNLYGNVRPAIRRMGIITWGQIAADIPEARAPSEVLSSLQKYCALARKHLPNFRELDVNFLIWSHYPGECAVRAEQITESLKPFAPEFRILSFSWSEPDSSRDDTRRGTWWAEVGGKELQWQNVMLRGDRRKKWHMKFHRIYDEENEDDSDSDDEGLCIATRDRDERLI